jgi:acyl-ACP thioesterase
MPLVSRVFRASRRVRLSDVDGNGLLRLDAVARYLQDVATDDIADAGWGEHDNLWIVRRTRIQVVEPLSSVETVELATWCSGMAASAAARSTSLTGDRGGLIETETIWIHLDASGRPARHDERFHELYGPAAAGRRASTRLQLGDPPADAARHPWPLRRTDIDQLGHVNNAAYWAAVEEVLEPGGTGEALLEYRQPLELGDRVELAVWSRQLAFVVDGEVRAAARVRRR